MVANRHFQSLIVLGLVFTSAACAFSYYSFATFDSEFWIIPIHVLIVLGMLAGSLLTSAVLRAIWKTEKWVTLLPVWAFAFSLCGIYLLNACGWAIWIDSVSFRLLKSYLSRSSTVGPNYPLLLSALLTALFLLLLPIVYRVVPALFRSISHLADSEGLAMFGRTRPTFNAIASLLLYASVFSFLFWKGMNNTYLSGEFILSFVSPVLATTSELPRTYYDVSKRPFGEDAPYNVSHDSTRKNVVVIVVDDLRADHLAAYGYSRDTSPLLSERLKRTPVLTARWATSACSISECGIVAINTSRPFQRQNAGLFSLPEALHRAGYKTHFIASGDFTAAFRGLYALVGKHAQVFADGLTQHSKGPYDDRVVLQSIDDLPDHSDSPAYFYFHLHSVHRGGLRFQPPTYTPTITPTDPYTFILNALNKRFTKIRVTGSAATEEMLTNNYDNGIRQADGVVEQILARLGKKGYLDRSVIVVTADHGEGLGAHGLGHGDQLYADYINVPLFIFDSQFQSSRTVPYATHLDIAPTIADLVGIPVPAQWEGTSLLGTLPDISIAQTTYRNPIESVIWRSSGTAYKYLYNTVDKTEQLFELSSDPTEQNNLASTQREQAVLNALREERIRRFDVKITPPDLMAGNGATAAGGPAHGVGNMSLRLPIWVTHPSKALFSAQ